MTYVNNTSQWSIFDTDLQEVMDETEKNPEVPLLEGDVEDEMEFLEPAGEDDYTYDDIV